MMAEKKRARKGDSAPKKHQLPEALKKNLWKAGQSGNPKGRPKGNRNKLGEAFLEALRNDFNEHGADAIQKCREDSPVAYVRVLASILPKDLNVTINPMEELTDAELIERIGQLQSAVDAALGGVGESSGGTEAPTRH